MAILVAGTTWFKDQSQVYESLQRHARHKRQRVLAMLTWICLRKGRCGGGGAAGKEIEFVTCLRLRPNSFVMPLPQCCAGEGSMSPAAT